jgi:hypothetical protein
MKKVYYEKVGRRYKPVLEYDAVLLDALPAGSHLITVYPGGSSRRYCIDPAFAPLIAAGCYARPAIEDALHKASEKRPTRKPITPEQMLAWQKLAEAFGDDLATLQCPSIHDIAQAGVDELQRQAEVLLKNPTVRKAYEHFLVVAKLAMESK